MAGKGTKNNQQNTQGEAQSEQAKQTQPLDFDVRIQSIKPSDAIKGTASVNINGAFAIRYPAIGTIARELHLSVSTVKRAISDLEENGFIRKKQRWRDNGGRSSLLFEIIR